MRRFHSVIATIAVMLFIFSLCAFSSFALNDSVTEITTDGWVNYKKLNLIQFTYKANSGQNESYVTKNVNDLPLPYGPKYTILDDQIISEFWFEISLYNVDPDEPTDSNDATNSTIAVLRPGDSIALLTGAKIFVTSRPEQSGFTPLDSSMYGCRLYLDNDYSRYLEPTLDVTTSNGAYLSWTFENNTDKDISLSRICFGLFEDSPIPFDSYGYGYIIRSLKYRIFTDSQKATQAVVDAIAGLGDQIDNLGDQIGNDIQNSTDKIVNGWDGSSKPPDGSDTIGDVEDLESSLVDGTSAGLSEMSTWFADSGSYLSMFVDTFGFIGHMFDLTQYFGDFYILVIISLSLGILAFLLGVVPSLIRRFK